MKGRVGLTFLSIFLGGCNFYSSIDSPTGDSQILSKARACFDQGDFECASRYYGMVSSESADEANGELAFQILAKNGVTTGVFISAAIDGSSSGGKFITKIANALTTVANQTTRLNLFHAFQKSSLISNQRSRGLIRFITAASFVAEILAENASSAGKVAQSDLVANPTTCIASKPLYNAPGCGAPPGNKLETGAAITSLQTATDDDILGPNRNPTLFMIHAGILELNASVTEMEATGNLGSSSSQFANTLITIAQLALVPNTDSELYRANLIELEVGEP